MPFPIPIPSIVLPSLQYCVLPHTIDCRCNIFFTYEDVIYMFWNIPIEVLSDRKKTKITSLAFKRQAIMWCFIYPGSHQTWRLISEWKRVRGMVAWVHGVMYEAIQHGRTTHSPWFIPDILYICFPISFYVMFLWGPNGPNGTISIDALLILFFVNDSTSRIIIIAL